MDFIMSYQLYKNIKKKENNINTEKNKHISSEKNKHISSEKENLIINPNCARCGQDPYFCQCENNIKVLYFNPEKDIY